jgi:hypothetical protein
MKASMPEARPFSCSIQARCVVRAMCGVVFFSLDAKLFDLDA